MPDWFHLMTASCSGLVCSCCGRLIQAGDSFCDCGECGAVYCEECINAGLFEQHDCEYN